MGKNKRKSPFTGLWHIVSLSEWDEDYINLVRAFIEFEPDGWGHLWFGLGWGHIDSLETLREGKPAIEWSWEGEVKMEKSSGRGRATLECDELYGVIFIHGGDHFDFVARRAKETKATKRQ